MPLRSLPLLRPPHLLQLRLFHTSITCRYSDRKPSHYEILQIPTNASPSEVKKSFYTLSKSHHPDRNPDDPNASSRFVVISEAYAILGTPAKRAAYDRELSLHSPHVNQHPHSHHGHRPQGSYHSSGPAGGRPASGLSSRRTQFRGPPPSFYRNGGWGEHSTKRKSAQENGAPASKAPPEYNNHDGKAGGMGPGQTPFGHDKVNDVPHFDREAHYRRHENQRERWQRRKGTDDGYVPAGDLPRSTLANFMFVSVIISVGVFIPGLIFERFSTKRKLGDNN